MVDYFDLIDDYMDDALSSVDKSNFEAAMATDIKLAHAVENYTLIKKLSSSLIEDEVRQQIKKIHEKVVKKTFPMWKYISGAASVILVIVSAFFLNKVFGNVSNDLIIQNLYQRPEQQGTRGEEEDLNRIDSAILNYELNDFEVAKSLFLPRPTNDSLSKIVDYF